MDTNKECVKEKILIVDDSPLVCEMFSNALCKKGYETTTANNEGKILVSIMSL